jgi:hypothetical protein
MVLGDGGECLVTMVALLHGAKSGFGRFMGEQESVHRIQQGGITVKDQQQLRGGPVLLAMLEKGKAGIAILGEQQRIKIKRSINSCSPGGFLLA